ncbi:MAG: alkanesulfonate monooxygenase [Pseudonocardiales bacterium]|nr:alkanesulfonate monooxygenase [Pseudonocardiales bacterium]
MTIGLHWFLPTSGDGRSLVESGEAKRSAEIDRPTHGQVATNAPSLEHLVDVAQAAEDAGFDAVLTPTGAHCPDAWVTTAALSQRVARLRFLVAFRPGTLSPTLAAQQAATFNRITGGRLALNIVTGGEDDEQRRFGDFLDKDGRYARTDEFLTVVRGASQGTPFDFHGEHVHVEGAFAPLAERAPEMAARRTRRWRWPRGTPTSTSRGASRHPPPRSTSSGCGPRRRGTADRRVSGCGCTSWPAPPPTRPGRRPTR